MFSAQSTPSGCFTCSGTGTQCNSGYTCVGGTCTPDSVYCTDGDGDGYCAESNDGSCDGTGICTAGYDDCNDGNSVFWQLFDNLWHDFDGDGYGGVLIGSDYCLASLPSGTSIQAGDCDDGNENVNPGVSEICNNGIDDDCGGDDDCSGVCVAQCLGTRLESCTTISSSGSYYLAEGDWQTSGSNCITVTADDVVLDGNNQILTATGGYRGVSVEGSFASNVSDFELKNLQLRVGPGSYGIYMTYVESAYIHKNNFSWVEASGTSSVGIQATTATYLLDIVGNNFVCNQESHYSQGIILSGSYDGTISFNFFEGLPISLDVNSYQRNAITDNEIIGNLNRGLEMTYKYNSVRRNSICESDSESDLDIYDSSCSYTTYSDNYCSLSNCGSVGCANPC